MFTERLQYYSSSTCLSTVIMLKQKIFGLQLGVKPFQNEIWNHKEDLDCNALEPTCSSSNNSNEFTNPSTASSLSFCVTIQIFNSHCNTSKNP